MQRRDLRSERGQTAVEFALIAPLIVVLLIAVIEVGISFHDYITLTDAARAGARQAVVSRFTGQTDAQLQQNVRNAAGDLDQTKLQVTVANPQPTTPGSTVTVTATYPYTIRILGWVVASGNLTSTMADRLE